MLGLICASALGFKDMWPLLSKASTAQELHPAQGWPGHLGLSVQVCKNDEPCICVQIPSSASLNGPLPTARLVIPADSAGTVPLVPVWNPPALASSGKTTEPYSAGRHRSRAHLCWSGGQASASAWPQACPSPAVSANRCHPSLAGRHCPEWSASICMPSIASPSRRWY